MRKIVAASVAIGLMSMSTVSAQQAATPPLGPDWSKIEVKTTDLGNRTYMLEGQGGNVTIALAEDGVIMVDSQFAPMHPKLKAAVAALTPLPVRFLINTHYHGDHTGGNDAFAKDGVTVVAHQNVRERLATGFSNGLTGARTPGLAAGFHPKQVYDSASTTIELQGRKADLRHPLNAHTDGDTYVYFADANVLATGDTVTIDRYPNIDFANGGTIGGMIAAADAYLALSNDATKVVPGHGPLVGKAQLAEFRTMLVASRDRIAKLIADGKTEAEAVAAKPVADYDARFKANDQQATNWIRVVYATVKK